MQGPREQTRARIKLAAGELHVSEIKHQQDKGLASRVIYGRE